MRHNINSIIKIARDTRSALKARDFDLSLHIYLNGKTVKLTIDIDVCATYISLGGKRISKKAITELFVNDTSADFNT